jgi:3-hydroxy-9,10-secoandrosta-1,3,5(10)-triene-9,17-dione monooxygenase reductase component
MESVAPGKTISAIGGAAPNEFKPIEARMLRKVCGFFATGVTVVTTELDGQVAGTTVNSFTSVSLEPPLALFCLHRKSRLGALLQESRAFTVNFLTGRQERVAWAFAARETALLQDLPHHRSDAGGPILRDALAYLSGRVVNEFEAGDHTIFLGEVKELGLHRPDEEPLVFFRGAMSRLEQETPAAHPIWDG